MEHWNTGKIARKKKNRIELHCWTVDSVYHPLPSVIDASTREKDYRLMIGLVSIARRPALAIGEWERARSPSTGQKYKHIFWHLAAFLLLEHITSREAISHDVMSVRQEPPPLLRCSCVIFVLGLLLESGAAHLSDLAAFAVFFEHEMT